MLKNSSLFFLLVFSSHSDFCLATDPFDKDSFDILSISQQQKKNLLPQLLETSSAPPIDTLQKLSLSSLPRKAKRRKKKNILSHKNFYSNEQPQLIRLELQSIDQLIILIEEKIQQVLERKTVLLSLEVPIENSYSDEFNKSFYELTKKYPFPFSWHSRGTSSINTVNEKRVCYRQINLSSEMLYREHVERDFAYQVSPQEKEMVDWELIYRLVMKSHFSVEDFKYNNALRIRVLNLLANTEEECTQEISNFINFKLSKDINPFHILAIKPNIGSALKASQIYDIYSTHISPYRKSSSDRGMIYGQEDCLYLCLNNEKRKTLDLHGKKKEGKLIEGRQKKQGSEETIEHIKGAYIDFQNDAVVITGRGNHINSNKKIGVLKTAFKEEWVSHKELLPLIKNYRILEGDGAYHVYFKKFKELSLTVSHFPESIELITQTIKSMVQNKNKRLWINLDFNVDITPINPEFKLMKDLTESLMDYNSDIFQLIYPLSFEAEPNVLRLIFNQIHSQAGHCLSFSNYINKHGKNITIIKGNLGTLST